MTKKKAQFSPHIYAEWGELFKNLTPEQQGQILMGITMYPNYNPENNPVWSFIKSQIDKEFESFNERCEKNSTISKNYWNQTKASGTERIPNDTERHPKQELEHKQEQEQELKEKNKKEKRPSLQEVIDYCDERNNGVDANKWYDYYTANGWKVGRNPMKDWKATVRTWERKQGKPAKSTNEGSEKMVLIDTTSFYLDDTMDEYKDLFEGVLNKDELALNVWKWIVKNFEGRSLKLSFIRSMIEKFKNEGGENERSIEK